MRYLIFAFLMFTLSLVGAQGEYYVVGASSFRSGDQVYLFGDQVKLRSAPGTEGEVLSLMDIGETVTILEATDKHMMYNGIEWPWYKVQRNEEEGYVLGGLLAIRCQQLDGYTYLCNCKSWLKLVI